MELVPIHRLTILQGLEWGAMFASSIRLLAVVWLVVALLVLLVGRRVVLLPLVRPRRRSSRLAAAWRGGWGGSVFFFFLVVVVVVVVVGFTFGLGGFDSGIFCTSYCELSNLIYCRPNLKLREFVFGVVSIRLDKQDLLIANNYS